MKLKIDLSDEEYQLLDRVTNYYSTKDLEYIIKRLVRYKVQWIDNLKDGRRMIVSRGNDKNIEVEKVL